MAALPLKLSCCKVEEEADTGIEHSIPSTAEAQKHAVRSNEGKSGPTPRLDLNHHVSSAMPVTAGAVEIATPCNLWPWLFMGREGPKVHLARDLDHRDSQLQDEHTQQSWFQQLGIAPPP